MVKSKEATGVGMAAYTHPGVDISMGRGTPLYAAASGTVTFAGWSPRFYRPNQVQITTPDGQLHIYAHMWTVDTHLTVGSQVKRRVAPVTAWPSTRNRS